MQSHDDSRQGSDLSDELRLMRTCPLCRGEYANDAVRQIDEHDGVHLIHLTCSACAGAVLAVITVTPFGVSSVGTLTDLSADDVIRTQHAAPVDEDDVLAFHDFLHEKELFHYLNRIK